MDKETTGLLLFTDDHDFNHFIRRSGNSVTKEYTLRVEGIIANNDHSSIVKMMTGIQLHDGIATAQKIRILGVEMYSKVIKGTKLPSQTDENKIIPNGDKKWSKVEIPVTILSLEINEGRKHVIRKMSKISGLKLVHLHRSRIGTVNCPEKEGDIHQLSEQEVFSMWNIDGQTEIKFNRIRALIKIEERVREEGVECSRLTNWLQENHERNMRIR